MDGVREDVIAFAPGRLNLIGEHTDYNEGLALPFAIHQGVTVRAGLVPGAQIEAIAADLGEADCFDREDPRPAGGWRGYVRGVAGELRRAGLPLRGARLTISSTLPSGAGLSSSAALEAALCLALLACSDAPVPPPLALARICSRVENGWVGVRSGLLDPLASICGKSGSALRIDFRSLEMSAVTLTLEGFRLVVVDSGERRQNAGSAYNQRRAECVRACRELGIASLRELGVAGVGGPGVGSVGEPSVEGLRELGLAGGWEPAVLGALRGLPAPLGARVHHVLGENRRVERAVAALRRRDLPELGVLLDASHASLRDSYEVSTPAVEATVARLRRAGAIGARMVGGGCGGYVLGLLAPDVPMPTGAVEVHAGPGAWVRKLRSGRAGADE